MVERKTLNQILLFYYIYYKSRDRNLLTYEIIGRLNAAAILPSWTHVSCGPMYPAVWFVHNAAVCLILVASSPYVSAMTKSTVCPNSFNFPEFISFIASVIAPDIVTPVWMRRKKIKKI